MRAIACLTSPKRFVLPAVPFRGLQPPTPIYRADNWPLLPITHKSQLEALGLDGDLDLPHRDDKVRE